MTDRTQTIMIRDCPRCLRLSLTFTGAFWSCAACGYAITQRALDEETRLAAPSPRRKAKEA